MGQGVRVLCVYGPASPAYCPKTVERLYRDLLNEFSRARRKNVPVIVMGDFNDVPEGDLDFAPRARKYPKKFNLINALNTRSLDVFRTIHPSLHGHSFQLKKKRRRLRK